MSINSFFSYIKNKKGQGLPTETIVIVVILLIVLVVLVLIFTSQSNEIFSDIKEFLGLVNSTPLNGGK